MSDVVHAWLLVAREYARLAHQALAAVAEDASEADVSDPYQGSHSTAVWETEASPGAASRSTTERPAA